MTETKPKEKVNTPTITDQVLERLGRPDDLYRVDIRKVGKGRARINVWRSLPIEPTMRFGMVERSCFSHKHQITDSFYCQVDNGTLINTNPNIKRRYNA